MMCNCSRIIDAIVVTPMDDNTKTRPARSRPDHGINQPTNQHSLPVAQERYAYGT